MSKIVVVLFVSLLPFICCENPERKLIDELNKFFNFDHNVFLLESSQDIDRSISSTSQTPQTVYIFKNVTGNITEWDTLPEIRSKNTFTIIALNDSSSLDRNIESFKKLKTIHRPQIKMKIGVFFQHFGSMDDLRTLFEWCKDNLIVNIFAAIQGPTTEDELNIFTFHPFGPFDIINVTISESNEDYFPSLQSNFHQQRLLVPPIDEEYEDIWSVVLRMMNGSSVEKDVSKARDLSEYYEDIHMTFNSQTQEDINELNAYPLQIEFWEMLVPEALPYEDFTAYLRIITSDNFFGFSLASIAGVMFFLTICRYIKESKILLLKSAADVLNLLMNDNGYIRYQRLSRAEFLVIGPLTFVGFIFVNGIISNLQSYLTRPVLQPQIKTFEEIYSSPTPIIASSDMRKTDLIEALANITGYADWNDKILVIESERYREAIKTYNTSAAFIEAKYAIDILLQFQKILQIKGYYNTKLRIQRFFTSYLLYDRFLYFDRFNDIVHRMKSAGLIGLWRERKNKKLADYIVHAYRKHLNEMPENVVQEIKFPTFIVYGWIAGSILFVLEIIWKNWKFLQVKTVATTLRRKFGKVCAYIAGKIRRYKFPRIKKAPRTNP